jgi:hypothetical protein
MPRIIPHHDTNRVITHDDAGYHITALGDEVATVDQSTGEVCRKRPALSRTDIPAVRPDVLASILADTLKNQGGSAKASEMAQVLLQRAQAHIEVLMTSADKLAAKSQVAKAGGA